MVSVALSLDASPEGRESSFSFVTESLLDYSVTVWTGPLLLPYGFPGAHLIAPYVTVGLLVSEHNEGKGENENLASKK